MAHGDDIESLRAEVTALRERVAELERELSPLTGPAADAEAGGLLEGIMSLPVILFRIDADGIFTESIGRGLERLGLRDGEAVGTSIFDGFPEIADTVREVLGGATRSWEASGTFADRPWSALGYLTYDGALGGGALGVSLDVTESADAKAELEASERRYRSLADSAPVGIVRSNADGECTYVNRTVCRIGGKRPDELLGDGWLDLVYEEDRDRVRDEFRRVLDDQRPFRISYRVVDAQGSAVWVSAHGRPEYDAADAFAGVVAVLVDITDRKQSEAEAERRTDELSRRVEERNRQLEASNRELEAFAYSVSHDLRAPLRGIEGFSRVLLEDFAAALGEDGRPYLDRIVGASKRMGELIDQLLSLSRVGRAAFQPGPVDLSALATAIVDGLRDADSDRVVDVRIDDGMTVIADEALLRSAMENLIGNAWKFTRGRERATIEICASRDHDGTVYRVSDDGAGFEMTYVEKLFVPFERLHRDDEFEGTGIGLATVQRILARHGGRIWAEGVPDGGASFYFTLPAPE